jgi:hypothetical protein
MLKIEISISEYCEKNLSPEPAWIVALNRRFPRIASRLDITKSIQLEIADHLRSAYEAFLSKEQDPEKAWQQAQDRFGDPSIIADEIRNMRAQSCKCLMIRLFAMIILFILPLGKFAHLSFPTFFKPDLLFFIALFAATTSLITRKRNFSSLRQYALYGSWIALAWGVFRMITLPNDPSLFGGVIAVILMSTFYGLFIAAPSSEGLIPPVMIVMCHIGVLTSLMRLGMLDLNLSSINVFQLKNIAPSCIVSILIALIVFDIRRLHLRTAGVASFAMIFAYINILRDMTRPYDSIPMLLLATSIPALIMLFSIKSIQTLRARLVA